MGYVVKYGDQSFEIEEGQCSYCVNDEENPIEGVDPGLILGELAQSDKVYFQKEYYDQGCEVCGKNRKEGAKYYDFLEYHFYLYSKAGKYVMSSLSAEYDHKILPDLLKNGTIDGSYIVSVNVCEQCGDYTIDMEFGLW